MDKWPRQYMTEILALPTHAERKQALEAVPENLRAWVQHLVEDQMNKPKKTAKKN